VTFERARQQNAPLIGTTQRRLRTPMYARGPDIFRLPTLVFRRFDSGNNFKEAIENYVYQENPVKLYVSSYLNSTSMLLMQVP
jgi:hypothetical protein